MRKDFETYYETDDEIKLIGIYRGINCHMILFKNLYNIETEKQTIDLHLKESEICYKPELKFGETYIIRGYVSKYTRRDGSVDYNVTEAIIEEI